MLFVGFVPSMHYTHSTVLSVHGVDLEFEVGLRFRWDNREVLVTSLVSDVDILRGFEKVHQVLRF